VKHRDCNTGKPVTGQNSLKIIPFYPRNNTGIIGIWKCGNKCNHSTSVTNQILNKRLEIIPKFSISNVKLRLFRNSKVLILL
jgi:hypothetical protein